MRCFGSRDSFMQYSARDREGRRESDIYHATMTGAFLTSKDTPRMDGPREAARELSEKKEIRIWMKF